MKVNPGGLLAPEDVVGRDPLIDRLWQGLESHGWNMTAERRMGKTSILRKMQAAPPDHMVVFCFNVEAIGSPQELVLKIFRELQQVLSLSTAWRQRLTRWTSNWGGGKMLGLELPKPEWSWKQNLEEMIRDFTAQLASVERLVLFLDELPIAIDNLRQKDPAVAMEVLNTLRSLRQECPQLRMIYTGSIGLHHVLRELQAAGYRNAPKNDLVNVEVEPFTEQDAVLLARDLLMGARVVTTDSLESIIQEIVTQVDRMPFYIHNVVAGLREMNRPILVRDVGNLIRTKTRATDAWEFKHYEERLKNYYGDRQPVALKALDNLMVEPLRVKELWQRILLEVSTVSEENIRDVLRLLEQDHYIQMNEANQYEFRFQLIRQYWQSQRG
jgi:hypothetical protein